MSDYRKREEKFREAIISGDLALLQEISRGKFYLQQCHRIIAVENGQLEVLKWLDAQAIAILDQDLTPDAVIHGHFNILEWLYETYKFPWSDEICNVAALYSRFEILQWLVACGAKLSEKTVVCAANPRRKVNKEDFDQVAVLKWMRENDDIEFSAAVSTASATGGNIELLEWLWAIEIPFNKQAYFGAITSNEIDVIKWLASKSIPYNKKELLIKAKYRPDMMKCVQSLADI
jgi:hypothetical protein